MDLHKYVMLKTWNFIQNINKNRQIYNSFEIFHPQHALSGGKGETPLSENLRARFWLADPSSECKSPAVKGGS